MANNLSPELRQRALDLFIAVLDQDEAATDKLLATFNPDEADGDEVLEVLGLAQHVLDVRMGYESSHMEDDGDADDDASDWKQTMQERGR